MTIEGGCNCGAVRYSISGKPVVVAQCHCTNCQKQSGSAFSVNLLVKADDVNYSGNLSIYEDTNTASGALLYRKFCGQCGSPIFSEQADNQGMVIVKAGTLDHPGDMVPAVSVWTETKLPWVELPARQMTFDRNAQ
ncbi:MAG: GFA family protein [Sphingomonadaceae bacterium]